MNRTILVPGNLIITRHKQVPFHSTYVEWQRNGWPLEGQQYKSRDKVIGMITSAIDHPGWELKRPVIYLVSPEHIGWIFSWEVDAVLEEAEVSTDMTNM